MVFSVGMYLVGLSGLAFLWFAWALREKLRQEDPASLAGTVAFGSALAWTGAVLGCLLVVTAALQPIVEPTVSRSEEEVTNIVSFLTGFVSLGLIPLWAIAVGVALFRRDGRTPGGADRRK